MKKIIKTVTFSFKKKRFKKIIQVKRYSKMKAIIIKSKNKWGNVNNKMLMIIQRKIYKIIREELLQNKNKNL